jgi:hypothetical protein
MTGDLLTPLWTAAEAPALTLPQWESLLSQARRARLAGRLARLFADRGWLAQVPEGPRVHLEIALRQVRRQQDEARWEADCIRRAIGHLPTPVVLLKGAAYVLAGLPPARGRLFTDVDILVAREQLRPVELALFASGWIPGRLDPYDERYYRDLMHELPPMQHVERGSALDVHHTLTPPTSRFAVDARLLLADARPLPDGSGLAVLAPADMVLHSAVHLMQDGDFSGGLRDLLDIADLLLHFGREAAFWPALVGRAGVLRLGRPLHDVLVQAERLAGTELPDQTRAALAAMATGRLRNRLMDALLTAALRPDHPDCDRTGTALARWLLYVRSHWLRMPWYQILPHLARKAWMRLRFRSTGKAADRRAPGPAI